MSDFEKARALAAATVVDPRHSMPVDHKIYPLDAIWVLYDQILRVTPETVDAVNRDRFLMSKGHIPAAYYAVLAAKGFIPKDWLADVGSAQSALGAHPDSTRVPGVEISSGSLGHGLPLAVGQVLGLRAQGLSSPDVYVLVGDAELDEGSNHEAIAFAGAAGLDQLVAVVVDNRSATYRHPHGMTAQFEANGWTSATVESSDHEVLAEAFRARQPGRPHVVVATTPQGE